MKKNKTKTKSPAPATTSTKSAARKPAAKPAAASAAPAPVSVPAPAPATVKAVAAAAAAPVQTRIVAQIDVGFGNALYVRGDGPGLSWNQGVLMECVGNDRWELTLGESSRPVSFKVLLNDATWCSGPDSVVASGSTALITPDFA